MCMLHCYLQENNVACLYIYIAVDAASLYSLLVLKYTVIILFAAIILKVRLFYKRLTDCIYKL